MNLNKAIEIAKEIEPSVGPALDMDRKNLSDVELAAKLRNFFLAYKQAAEFSLAHPDKEPEELVAIMKSNIAAHINNDFHIATFVASVLAKKGDLATLADSAAKRIVLSDPRIEAAFAKLKSEQKVAKAKEISAAIAGELTNYFENLKGKVLNREAIINELTTRVTAKVAETLKTI